MNNGTIKIKWLQLMGDIRHRWGKSSVDDLDQAQGDAERFIWKLQERYGYARDPGRGSRSFGTSVDVSSKPKR